MKVFVELIQARNINRVLYKKIQFLQKKL